MAQPKVDLSKLDTGMAGPRAQVLVLGSVHLSEMPKSFKPESLDPLLDRLAAFKPELITIEAISGEGCDLVARHPAVYAPEDVDRFCRDPSPARAATGLDVPAAIAEVRKTLKTWPAQPTPAQRRRLAATFLAANDSASAFVQWLYLPKSERHVGDGLDAALVALLQRFETRNNESFQIAAPVAVRLGLQRLYAVDDHTGDNVYIDDPERYGKAIQKAWDSAGAAALASRKQQDTLTEQSQMLALYRLINTPEAQRLKIDADFGAAMRETSPQHYGQLYVAGWEGRNLRMVANIRAAFADYPGARVLSIVGATHKPWFDNLLGQMQGVDVIDAGKILK
ncbi:DUF5694 domain-containing protein [Lysobacter sp. Root690]|uniref:DUF5694 domain-containing protein n=1 Tax=Lysobacter sp. Root690 TaxID=1736588 RepID=UPI0006FB3989|nr:DUF5694 domain-containing protein [Lysobacter sp. Root690]KRB07838.1 hypothetical protein ASD86_08465 [Lysobacter sp. Root690]